MTILSYFDDIVKLKAGVLYINVDTTVSVNKIFAPIFYIKSELNDVYAKLDQHERVQYKEIKFHAKKHQIDEDPTIPT